MSITTLGYGVHVELYCHVKCYDDDLALFFALGCRELLQVFSGSLKFLKTIRFGSIYIRHRDQAIVKVDRLHH
jgi:hypothetical protein